MTFTVATDFDRETNKEIFQVVDIPTEAIRSIVQNKINNMDYARRRAALEPYLIREGKEVPGDQIPLNKALDKLLDACDECLKHLSPS